MAHCDFVQLLAPSNCSLPLNGFKAYVSCFADRKCQFCGTPDIPRSVIPTVDLKPYRVLSEITVQCSGGALANDMRGKKIIRGQCRMAKEHSN